MIDAIKIKATAEFGKYIPGKLWGYGWLLIMYSQQAKDKKRIIYSSYLEIICSVLGAILLFLLSLIFIDNILLNQYKLFIFGLCIIFCFSIHPKLLVFITNFVLKLLKKELFKIEITFTDVLTIVSLYSLNWFLFGFSFYLFINSFYSISINSFFYVLDSFILSSLAGFIALFAPAGLGVREGVLILAFKQIMPASIAGIISVASRLWLTLGEIFVFVILIIISKLFKK